MKRKFIINPSAGRGTSGRSLPALRDFFMSRTGGFDFSVTNSRAETIGVTRKSLKEGYEQIVSVGGDGTLNAVANGFFDQQELINPRASLAVGQGGTACDYLRAALGKADWREVVLSGVAKPVDVGHVNLHSAGETVYFLNVASVGLSCEVVQRQRKVPAWVPPLLSYSIPALQTLLKYRPLAYQLTLDGKALKGEFLNLFFAKGLTAGGGMRLGGGVSLDDGLFDVTLVHGMPLGESLPRFAKLFTGHFQGDPRFTKTRAAHIEVKTKIPSGVECDGEVVGQTDITVGILSGALPLNFPQ